MSFPLRQSVIQKFLSKPVGFKFERFKKLTMCSEFGGFSQTISIRRFMTLVFEFQGPDLKLA